MTPESFSSLAYNQIWTLIGAGTILGFIVRPYQKKLTHATTALEQVTKELEKFQTARVVEKLNEHNAAIEELRRQRDARIPQRFIEHATIERNVQTMIEKSDLEARVGRKHLHEDIAGCRNDITKLGANVVNLEGWLKTLDERQDTKFTELVAAVANAAGRQGNRHGQAETHPAPSQLSGCRDRRNCQRRRESWRHRRGRGPA